MLGPSRHPSHLYFSAYRINDYSMKENQSTLVYMQAEGCWTSLDMKLGFYRPEHTSVQGVVCGIDGTSPYFA